MRPLPFAVAVLLAVLPSSARGADLHVQGEPLVLGEAPETTVTFEVDEPRGTELLPLCVAVNVGAFGPVVRDGPGRFHATYRLPATRFPQVALVAAWRETGPEAPVDLFRIPLYGVTHLDVSGVAGGEVTAHLGPRVQGPFRLDRRGNASLRLEVPPGVSGVELALRSPSGSVVTRRVAMELPRYNRLFAVVVPQAVPTDGKSWARLEVLVDDARAIDPNRLRISAGDAAVTPMTVVGNRFTYRLDPGTRSGASAAAITVRLPGDSTSQADASLALSLPPADAVLLAMEPSPLVAGSGGTVPLRVRVQTATGLGLPRQPLALEVQGQALTAITDEGNGWYRAAVPAPDALPPGGVVHIRARLNTASDHSPTAELTHPVVQPSLATASVRRPPPIEEAEAAVDATPSVEAPPAIGGAEGTSTLGIGARAGVASAEGQTFSPRVGLEAFGTLSARWRLGVAGAVSQLTSEIAAAGPAATAQARWATVSARLAFTPLSTGRFAAWLGAGPLLTLASFSRPAAGVQSGAAGFGGQGFADAALRIGPGELFTEVAWGWAPARVQGFSLQGGGFELGGGYRFTLGSRGTP